MSLANLSVRTKLLATLSILILTMLIMNIMGLGSLAQTNQQLSDLYEGRTRPVADVGGIYGLQMEAVQVLDAAMALQTKAALDNAKQTIRDNRGDVEERIHPSRRQQQRRADRVADLHLVMPVLRVLAPGVHPVL